MARDRHGAGADHPTADAVIDVRVVALSEFLDELVSIRDLRHALDVRTRRFGSAVFDVVGDRAVEQKIVLQHDAQVPPILGEPQVREVAVVGQYSSLRRPVERHHQADQRALARSARSNQRRRRRLSPEVSSSDRAGVVFEPDVLN